MESYQTIVIGGGQAGLAMGYYLQRLNQHFLIVDAVPAIGHSWRTRWDSLTMFTPAAHNGLPGLAMDLPPNHHPTKDEAADYLVRYATHFDLPIRLNTPITRLWQRDDGVFVLETAGGTTLYAQQVVVATGPFHVPNIPPFAAELTAFNIHSSDYRNPAQLPPGPVTVIGGANSGAQIAAELAPLREVTLARRTNIPSAPGFVVSRWGFSLVEALGFLDITVESWLARHVIDTSGDMAVFGVNLRRLQRDHGLRLRGEVTDATGDVLVYEGQQAEQVGSVIWATGFQPDYGWVDLPTFDDNGRPCHRRGVSQIPGLYFLGLSWLWTRGSALMGWVGRDAATLAQHIDARALERSRTVMPSKRYEEIVKER